MKGVLVFPVHNEEQIIMPALTVAVDAIKANPSINWTIVVSENGSTDNTLQLAQSFAKQCNDVEISVIASSISGKGSAIRAGWVTMDADVYMFSDIDQSIDLREVLPCIAKSLLAGASAVTIVRSAGGDRPWYRQVLSKSYRLLSKFICNTKLRDLPCGCKAFRKDIITDVLPLVIDDGWFFDSELLLLAEEKNVNIVEIESKWIEQRFDGRQERLNFRKVILTYLHNLIRIKISRLKQNLSGIGH